MTLPRMLCVRVGEALSALPVESVGETMRMLPITAIESQPPFVRGLAIVRGEPTPVIDLGTLLALAPAASRARLVTLRVDRRRAMLAVDEVLGVRALSPGALATLPPVLGEAAAGVASALAAVDGSLLLVLRAARLVPDGVWRLVEEAR